VKVVEGSWIYNFSIHHILHFYSKILGKTRPNVDAPTRLGPRRAGPRRAALASGRRPTLLGRAPCPRPHAPKPRAPSRPASYPRHNCIATPYRGRRTRGTGGPSAAAVRCSTPAYKGPVFSFVRVHLPHSFPCHALPAPASTCHAAVLPAEAAAAGHLCAARRPLPRESQPPKSSPRRLKTLPSSSPGRERRRARRIPASRAGRPPQGPHCKVEFLSKG
jgi:hypothetical protein